MNVLYFYTERRTYTGFFSFLMFIGIIKSVAAPFLIVSFLPKPVGGLTVSPIVEKLVYFAGSSKVFLTCCFRLTVVSSNGKLPNWSQTSNMLKFVRVCAFNFVVYVYSLDIFVKFYNNIFFFLFYLTELVYKIPIYSCSYFQPEIETRFVILKSEVYCSQND